MVVNKLPEEFGSVKTIQPLEKEASLFQYFKWFSRKVTLAKQVCCYADVQVLCFTWVFNHFLFIYLKFYGQTFLSLKPCEDLLKLMVLHKTESNAKSGKWLWQGKFFLVCFIRTLLFLVCRRDVCAYIWECKTCFRGHAQMSLATLFLEIIYWWFSHPFSFSSSCSEKHGKGA